jgi:hypothetical protein
MATSNIVQANYSGNDIAAMCFQTGAVSGQDGFHTNLYSGAVTSVTTTSTSVTAAVFLGGLLVNNAATAVTATLDTAANIVKAVDAASGGANVGDLFECLVINGGSATGAITVAAGTGGSFDANVPAGNRTVAIQTQKIVAIRLTNVTSGSEAYTIFM